MKVVVDESGFGWAFFFFLNLFRFSSPVLFFGSVFSLYFIFLFVSPFDPFFPF